RLVPNEDKQDIFLRLLEFDSNGDLPYPLRSVHQPAAYSPPESATPELKEEAEKLVHRAEALVAIGCYQPAAETYRHLAERDPESAELWQNAGFCAAWDGNEAVASEGLHRAAKLHQDAEIAVECETLAQLLDLNQPEAQLPVKSIGYRISSVSRLLTLLDEHERIVRLPEMNERPGSAETITYTILDRPALPDDPELWPELDTIPCSIGQIGIVDQPGENDFQAFLSGLEDESFQGARDLFESCVSELIESQEEEGEDLRFATSREQAPMLFTWHFPDKLPVIRQSQLEERRWTQNVDEIWPNLSLAGLGGKSPNEARGDASLEIPLRAAIYVLDAFCDRNGHLIDIKALCEKFQVAPPQPIETKPDLPLQTYSVMQLHRLIIPELSDEQLLYVLNRVLLIHHGGFLHDVLIEALNRPSCSDKVDRERTYNTLSELARDRNDRDETYRWIKEGQENAKSQDQAFEKVVRWEMRELTFRAEDPGDPNLMPLVNRLVQKYAKKLPQFVDYVTTLLQGYGIDPPANLAEMAEQDSGSFSSGGIWTPGEEPTDSSEKKIWLPGQS
ncbi:MAG: hypothetical protein KDA84_04585, partial [Planctomycetaceae bacterium]|nr:hypothetical protein [Planctomycetaceae bacterium]